MKLLIQERCSPQSSGNSGKAVQGDGTHLQSAVNEFSAFTKWQPDAHAFRRLTVLKRFEKLLRQRNCKAGTPTHLHKTVRSAYHRAVDRKYTVCTRLLEHVYTGHTGGQKKALEASDISSLVRRRKEPARRTP